MADLKMWFLASFLIILPIFVEARVSRNDICKSNTLAVYKLRMDTHWSNETFPKQYPLYRPAAQFSRLLGMVHDPSYVLWRNGTEAKQEIRMVAEKGVGELLEQRQGVQDVFAAPPVVRGVGSTETIFYSDGKHHLVSVISKIVPSPDWFVGLDSYELCSNGRWISNVSVQVGPFDAGTDNGFTFTAPDWPSEPTSPIIAITSQHPDHPANSFYYPELEALPPLATFHITRERIYRATDGLKGSKRRRNKLARTNPVIVPLPNVIGKVTPDGHRHISPHVKRVHRKSSRQAVDCVLGHWSSWSSCSASCGVGFEVRTRKLTKPPKFGGSCSREMQQKRWCGGHTKCIERFFNW
ncbi:spondin-2-like isoform X2 [Neodiprion virginianus]|uniref:spondin-2-like isoform X2 n=1 Tax=Neodiprion virginianus TaxID=2961670 RepID=UPI001EE69BF4|nr:spondin-2-like isoform X2 [Neodiprion virginianus]